jgi:hypothetical protein
MSHPEKKEKKVKPPVQATETIVVSDQKMNDWVAEIYDTSKLSKEELLDYYEFLRYKGFNRNEVLKQMSIKLTDRSIAIQVILLCAIQGPIRAAKTKLKNGQTPQDLGIPASGQKGTQNLSCARITAATADLAAYLMKQVEVPKRLNVECPSWLQFPSAGSIKLPQNLRAQHKEFSVRFSEVIGGEFNESIYDTMIQNSYLDERLSLFN